MIKSKYEWVITSCYRSQI